MKTIVTMSKIMLETHPWLAVNIWFQLGTTTMYMFYRKVYDDYK